MSLDIDQIALHQLIKRDEQNLELVLRESLLEPNATVVEMMAELHRVYSAKAKPMASLMKRASWRKRCVYSVRVKKNFFLSAVRPPAACAMSWRSIRLPKAALCCSVSIVTWRSSICWWRCSII